jgi:Mn2+/Fe2+ NRAMP family transporter
MAAGSLGATVTPPATYVKASLTATHTKAGTTRKKRRQQ